MHGVVNRSSFCFIREFISAVVIALTCCYNESYHRNFEELFAKIDGSRTCLPYSAEIITSGAVRLS